MGVSVPSWHEEPISREHDRNAFDCANPALNEFLRLHARKSHDLGGAKTFLAIRDAERAIILGFYSLAPASLAFERTPTLIKRGLARHEVPVFRLARLAVARSMQGRGLGGQLLLAAGRRCLLAASQVGGVALLIDAKDERAAQWYSRYGATPLQDQPLSLVLPLKTVHTALTAAGKI
ncbi:GNAT family N-acetyltransferase [Desulfonatronum parangueonense]